jgi:type II secretory pathway pseudopilin PulG
LCFDNNTVVIIGILAAIAIPNYIGQQKEAKDTAAMAQLRTATYCMQAPGGTNTFKMTQDTGLPVSGIC